MEQEALYIRNSSDTEARGPLTLRQIADLAESGHVSPQTLVRAAGSHQWVSLESRPELMHALRPEIPKLMLRTTATTRSDSSGSSAIGVDVHDLLASAQEGPTPKGADEDSAKEISVATAIARFGAIVGLVLAAIATLTPAREAIISLSGRQLLAQPLAGLGLLDLGLVMLLALGVASAYPLIRVRAAAGLGFAGLIYYTQGRGLELALTACGCTGVFFCTLVIRRAPALVSSVLAVVGMGLLVCSTLAS